MQSFLNSLMESSVGKTLSPAEAWACSTDLLEAEGTLTGEADTGLGMGTCGFGMEICPVDLDSDLMASTCSRKSEQR